MQVSEPKEEMSTASKKESDSGRPIKEETEKKLSSQMDKLNLNEPKAQSIKSPFLDMGLKEKNLDEEGKGEEKLLKGKSKEKLPEGKGEERLLEKKGEEKKPDEKTLDYTWYCREENFEKVKELVRT